MAALCLSAMTALQAPAQPVATEVEYDGTGGFHLSGTLLMPDHEPGTVVPAALLLPGSGPTDRNGNQPPIFVTDLLKQIAERLADEGVATLRFDKRAAHTNAAQWPEGAEALNDLFAYENFVADARAAYDFLGTRPGVDPARVSIVGHSEGGLIALSMAEQMRSDDGAPASLVLLSTAGRKLDVVIHEQIARLLDVQGADDATKKQFLQMLDDAVEAVKAGRDVPPDLPPGLAPLFSPSSLKILRSYFTIDPAQLAAKVVGPVLIVQGKADVQVSAERDAPRLHDALKTRDEGSTRLLLVEWASHNLKHVQNADDPGFSGPVADGVLDAIVNWIAKGP